MEQKQGQGVQHRLHIKYFIIFNTTYVVKVCMCFKPIQKIYHGLGKYFAIRQLTTFTNYLQNGELRRVNYARLWLFFAKGVQKVQSSYPIRSDTKFRISDPTKTLSDRIFAILQVISGQIQKVNQATRQQPHHPHNSDCNCNHNQNHIFFTMDRNTCSI